MLLIVSVDPQGLVIADDWVALMSIVLDLMVQGGTDVERFALWGEDRSRREVKK